MPSDGLGVNGLSEVHLMLVGMIFGVFVTVAELTLSPPTPPAAPHARHAPLRRPLERPSLPPAGELYSLRARRRFAAYLRLRLLEMRKAGLERAADVVEHRLPANTLFSP